MKKVLFLFLAFGVGRLLSQTVIYSEGFSGSPGFSNSTGWIITDLSTSGFYTECDVPGSSGTDGLVAEDGFGADVGDGPQYAVSPSIGTTTFVNITVSWNMYLATSSSPSVAFEWSNNAGSSWNPIAYTAPPTTGSWTPVPAVSLPSGASLTNILLRWYYTGDGTYANFISIDDIEVKGTPTPSYYYKGTGDLDNLANWGTATNGTGTAPTSFTASNQNFFLRNGGSASLTNDWTISGASSFMNIGDGSGNNFNLTIPSSFSINLTGGAKLVVNNNSILTIQNTIFPSNSNVTIGSNSTIDWAQTSATVTIWPETYGNLTFSGSGSRVHNGAVTVWVNKAFIIGASCSYVMSTSPSGSTRLSGAITCNGTISTGNSNLTIDGSPANAIGTLNFTGTNAINNLILNRSGQTLTLGANLSLSGVLSAASLFTNGKVNLNGKSLTINGPVAFPVAASNGVFIGSSTSSVNITGSGSYTNSLFMDQTTPGTSNQINFTLNRASQTLVLGNNLVTNAAVFTNGSLNLNGKAVNMTGDVTFHASSSNGVFVGSTTSSLTLSGTSTVLNNSLFMSQASAAAKSLGFFLNQKDLSTLVLGNDLIVSGTASLIAGTIIDLNGTLLTLSGPLWLPTGTAGSGFIGSLTSSLAIDGASAINSGSIIMVQSTSASRSLSKLLFDRSSGTLILRTPLETYGEIYVNSGTLASNGNLFIRSDASNKGRIAPVVGTITGNIKVETFAASGNTGWTQLGASGVNGVTVASWDTQIPMTCTGCFYSPLAAGGVPFHSVQGWNPLVAATNTTGYLPLISTSPLNPGVGCWTYLGDQTFTTNAITWTVAGTAVQGTQTVVLSASSPFGANDGFNLISNPFPSPISWDAVVASNPAAAGNDWGFTIYNYNPDLGLTSSYNQGTSSPNVAGAITNTIAMGQGFYIRSVVATSTVNIFESNKIRSNSPLLRTTNNIGSIVRLSINGGGYYDDAVIRFHGDATPDFDKKWDAEKIFGAPSTSARTYISTKSGNQDYSINSLPYALTQDAVIPVLVKRAAAGQYTITGLELENVPNSCVELKDKLLNTTHNLKNGAYVFNISAENSEDPRFELRVCADAAMSVDEVNGNIVENNVFIGQDANGAYVKLNYDKATKTTISVTNILGQKVVDTKSVTVDKDVVYLNIPEKNQLVFVTVTSENGKVTKKIVR